MQKLVVESLKINNVGQRVVILKQESGPMYLAIWIATAEADSIAIRLQKIDIPRPLTHDLLCNSISELDGKIEKIIITDIKNDTFYAKIIVNRSGKIIQLDSRPSDAISVALQANVHIYCEDSVLEKAGFKKRDIDDLSKDKTNKKKSKEMNSRLPLGDKERKSLSVFESFIDTLDIDE
jgi:hypothetical protein|tara:strand:- start:151 stop:687 length:537 start_codon:yes stop_codon:yes gene_type:complete